MEELTKPNISCLNATAEFLECLNNYCGDSDSTVSGLIYAGIVPKVEKLFEFCCRFAVEFAEDAPDKLKLTTTCVERLIHTLRIFCLKEPSLNTCLPSLVRIFELFFQNEQSLNSIFYQSYENQGSDSTDSNDEEKQEKQP